MCNTCYGYGLWAIGDPAPMGKFDASDGMPTIECPECHLSYNDKDSAIRKKSRTTGSNNPFFGKLHTQDSKDKMSDAHKGNIPWNKGKSNVYSEATLTQMSNSKKGKPSPKFKGKGITKQGYVIIFDPDHPNANKKGYVFEQRKVASEMLGRPLLKNEKVHHIDGNKQNNIPENLYTLSNVKSHTKLHNQMNIILFDLYKLGIVGFDKEKGEYFHKYSDIIKGTKNKKYECKCTV